ncbi:MAG: spondin domain-containing protein, partial [Cyanobacteria bacterium J06598_3]
FDASNHGQLDGQIGQAPIAPGATVRSSITVDGSQDNAAYFSYASMVLPSNDFFVANGDPLEHRIFDDLGNFIGAEFYILGNEVLDAGTEVNDELAESTAFFGQSSPNTGTTQTGTVAAANGFVENGRILSAEQFANADYTAEGYQVAKVEVGGAEVSSTFATGESCFAQLKITRVNFSFR